MPKRKTLFSPLPPYEQIVREETEKEIYQWFGIRKGATPLPSSPRSVGER